MVSTTQNKSNENARNDRYISITTCTYRYMYDVIIIYKK